MIGTFDRSREADPDPFGCLCPVACITSLHARFIRSRKTHREPELNAHPKFRMSVP